MYRLYHLHHILDFAQFVAYSMKLALCRFSKDTKDTHNSPLVNNVVLVFLLLTLNIFHTFSSVSIVDFEQENGNWERDCNLIVL